MQAAKTAVAFQDLSGIGRCALTVAIPVLSAMGVQAVPAPTAVLSAHTAFADVAVHDLTAYLEECLISWEKLGFSFDCVYTGYFASVQQLELAKAFMRAQPGALKVVDPVFGDHGVMYRGMPEDIAARLRGLCDGADVITPNPTEAALLTDTEYLGDGTDLARITAQLEALMALGPKRALITGAVVDGRHANAWMDGRGRTILVPYEAVPAAYPGTGDLFASVIAGGLTRGDAFEDTVALATDYVRRTIQYTRDLGTDPRLGVQLEKTLYLLCGREEEEHDR